MLDTLGFQKDVAQGCPEPQPLDSPTFTLQDIRAAIPAHCFVRSLWKSSMYTIWNLVIVGFFFVVARTFQLAEDIPFAAGFVFWPLYWYVQGVYMTGLWVIAHECGHQSFSDYQSVNDFVGTILHSLLLVPYHSWRITHRRHHSNTGSIEHDEVFVPVTRKDVEAEWNEQLEHSPLYNLFCIVRMLTVGWIPGYLVMNLSGPAKNRGKNASHFSTNAVFFAENEKNDVFVSVIAWVIAAAFLIYMTVQLSFKAMVQIYFIPYMVVNLFLVLITCLQHTDVYLPHMRGEKCTWLHGALCTVDRSFGKWLDGALHHITDTHFCHHLFSKMPFYHAEEATEGIKKVIGPYYIKDDTPILKALWRAQVYCKFVEDDGDVVFFKSSIKKTE